jgi:hypothetical protein
MKIIILGITLLATSLFSQEVGFNDSVKLKNGKVFEKVKAVAVKDSLTNTKTLYPLFLKILFPFSFRWLRPISRRRRLEGYFLWELFFLLNNF